MSETGKEPRHWTLLEAANRVRGGSRIPSAGLFENGNIRLRIYAPRGSDWQATHSQDELYIIARGSGRFFNGTRRHSFRAGDALFVPAGVDHRFEAFTDDLLVWVVFFGPGDGTAGGTDLAEAAAEGKA
jgi:mannose-6-phosphate isomerase-like protein (cupin superfamily)